MSYLDIADVDYHKLDHLSQSKLKKLIGVNWPQYQALLKTEYKSDAFKLGKIAHEVNLQATDVLSIPSFKKIDGRSKEGKEQAKSLAEIDRFIWDDERDALLQMNANFVASYEASAILNSAVKIEGTGIIKIHNQYNPEEPVTFKFRPDIIGVDFLADYKTIGEFATNTNIRMHLRKYKYQFQAAAYLAAHKVLTGKMINNFYLIFQESVEPYGVRVIQIPQHELEYGFDLFDETLKKYLKCAHDESKHSPNYSGIQEILINEI